MAAEVAQRKKTFEPHVEVLRVGSTVAFPNLDRIYHNVFSLSEIAPFDLGLYRNGASRSLAFPRPGIVRIYCNIHPSMSAFLVVVNSDAFGKTGRRRQRRAARGAGRHVAGVRVAREGRRGTGPASPSSPDAHQGLDLRLDASGWRPHPHRNKYGKDYPPPDEDEDRY